MDTSNLTGSRSKTKRRHIDADIATSSDEESVQNVDSWPRFLVVEGGNSEPLKINPFVVSKSIEGICGTVRNVTRLRSGSLLVECTRRQQSQNLLKAHHFANTEIVVSEHKTLNSCRGIVRDRAKCLSDMSEEEIVTELKPQGVSSVKRFTRKDGDNIVNTNTYLFTFALTKIPTSIKAGYFNIGVYVYIPNPLRCFKCQRFGHGAKSCRNAQVCSRCSKQHESTECTDDIKCANCSGTHMSSSKSCPSFVTQTQILKLKYTKDISFTEARKLVTNAPTTPSPSLTYSAAVSSTPLKSDNGCQTAISWVSNDQKILYPIDAEDSLTSSASQTDSVPEPVIVADCVHAEKTNRTLTAKERKLTAKERKQQRKKEARSFKNIKVPSTSSPVDVHNVFEPLDMEVNPSLPLQHRGQSNRSLSPVKPP
ncbi:uncharacterized protein LOC124273651 [Haliotis rubra]|uniref:uncharacterized protein LOC124273651 n=1 Tax=Haliotis rubra TaxID=36100 RepID=UPI001EE5BE09|nr:uncharacterized protein LOC124273651 [Haliotis rubra]